MKKLNFVFCFMLVFFLKSSAQTVHKPVHTSTVCSLVSEGDGSRISGNSPLILYMNDSVGNHKIDIVFMKAVRDKMSYDPYLKLVNQTVCVTGKVTTYNNVPAIIIHSAGQIKTNSVSQVNKMTSNN